MKKIYVLLFIVIVLVLVLPACGVKPANSAPCPTLSTMTGDCLVKPGSEPMMANSIIPVGMGTYNYVEVTAPEGTKLYASVVNGEAQIEGQGTNSIRLYRLGALATVTVTAECPAECPVEVQFTGYGQP